MKAEQISFTSRINFVTAKEFENKIFKGGYIGFSKFEENFLKADEFYTTAIRTCTAGGLVDTKNCRAIGFHYYDDLENNMNIQKFLNKMFSLIKNPDRAFLIGGKDLKFSPYSLLNFNEIKDLITQKVPYVSYFKEHVLPFSESNIHYDLRKDEWTVNSVYKILNHWNLSYKGELKLAIAKYNDVATKSILQTVFGETKIAKGDTLFINGNCVDLTPFN